jgi:streptomycin 6-kinase
LGNDEEYEVTAIVAQRVRRKKPQYLVQWAPVNFARAVVLGEVWHHVDTAVDSASLHGPLSDANVAAANNKGWWIIYLVGQWLQRRHQVPEEGAESLELRGTYC